MAEHVTTVQEANAKLADALEGNSYFKHAFSEQFRRMFQAQYGIDLWKQPICPVCQKIVTWDKGGKGYCKKHGGFGPPVMTFGEFLEKGYWVDRTVHPSAPVIVNRRVADPSQVATVYGGEADLADKDKAIRFIVPSTTPKE